MTNKTLTSKTCPLQPLKVACGSALLGALFSSSNLLAADVETGVKAYDSGDYETALQHIPELAKQGNATAQLYLGYMYEYGHGMSQNIRTAAKWYLSAAQQGHPSGQSYLGDMYLTGMGVKKNIMAAICWYTLAAEQGDSMAQHSLGEIYLMGHGVKVDEVSAYMWFSIAENNGEDRGDLEELSSVIDSREIQLAQRKAQRWLAKYE
ncbi:sel1 repeat family protein [Aestuariirhabdus sp. Z084]|uniref:tetratricopeptide repeat protein n=1 Tax=Aestuariirhabdus haliotis TaxID=2918751 RepID=UPI00201B458C|nr:tetratricopeptide repeat protein [Aestuariirhabdus haliotis]MCL6416728.1 sel1 repeat family protein [Aestuariirhabdus haliotis]MCL6420728.1 sel1 repeat family protein [Aestuariirhabdus haliotis]